MPISFVLSRFLTIGLALAALLSLLTWGFRQAPEVAQQQLLADIEPAAALPEPVASDAMEALPLHPTPYAFAQTEAAVDATALLSGCNIQRPSLPPREEVTFPIFPGCEGEADYEERVLCGFRRFAKFIEANKIEPDGSKRERVGVSFVVHRQTGAILDVEVFHGQDQRNIDEALRIFNLLVERDVRFIPGTRRGEPFNFPLAVPVSFHGAGCGE